MKECTALFKGSEKTILVTMKSTVMVYCELALGVLAKPKQRLIKQGSGYATRMSKNQVCRSGHVTLHWTFSMSKNKMDISTYLTRVQYKWHPIPLETLMIGWSIYIAENLVVMATQPHGYLATSFFNYFAGTGHLAGPYSRISITMGIHQMPYTRPKGLVLRQMRLHECPRMHKRCTDTCASVQFSSFPFYFAGIGQVAAHTGDNTSRMVVILPPNTTVQ